MPWFKSKEKGAEICAALIDVLGKIDKDISTWDGKLCNKKFYLFLRERVNMIVIKAGSTAIMYIFLLFLRFSVLK